MLPIHPSAHQHADVFEHRAPQRLTRAGPGTEWRFLEICEMNLTEAFLLPHPTNAHSHPRTPLPLPAPHYNVGRLQNRLADDLPHQHCNGAGGGGQGPAHIIVEFHFACVHPGPTNNNIELGFGEWGGRACQRCLFSFSQEI